MARRSKLEMWLDILSIINSGTSKPTRILYQANLSWRTLQQILGSMVSRGLIREMEILSVRKQDKRTTRRYENTQKGENYIRHFKRAVDLFQFEE
ncbi:MAG: winged helix-turn-helix domain-containing protein [Candidatus Bathyarchaeota archaeon]|nr:winged helix-turn-helix domain-containing protein [Candidatus Bathyarchaeota archaeon]